jgi:hypothetical protein
MIALLKYGSGVPFNRLEKLQHNLGIPMPAATQWGIVEEVADPLTPAWNELIRQAAQGEVFHNDDPSMRVLRFAREPSDKRSRRLYQRHRVAGGHLANRAILYRAEACGRKHCASIEAACRRTACANPDVFPWAVGPPIDMKNSVAVWCRRKA